MRRHRWLTTGLALGLLLTTATSTTYAQSSGQQNNVQLSGLCSWLPWLPWCNTKPGTGGGGGGGGLPSPSATPELDSLVLFGLGLTGLGGYAVTRFRAGRRP